MFSIFFLSENVSLHLFEAFLPNIIHLLALSMTVLLLIKVNFFILKFDFRPPHLLRPPPHLLRPPRLLNFKKLLTLPSLLNPPVY